MRLLENKSRLLELYAIKPMGHGVRMGHGKGVHNIHLDGHATVAGQHVAHLLARTGFIPNPAAKASMKFPSKALHLQVVRPVSQQAGQYTPIGPCHMDQSFIMCIKQYFLRH